MATTEATTAQGDDERADGDEDGHRSMSRLAGSARPATVLRR